MPSLRVVFVAFVVSLVNSEGITNETSEVNSNVTEPSAYSEQIERITIESSLSPNLTIPESLGKFTTIPESPNKTSKVDMLSDFKPSTPLGTFYEYNKVPVVPALPESKHHRLGDNGNNYNWGELPPHSSRWSEPEKPWLVKFPSYPVNNPPTNPQRTKERPYEFDTGEKHTGKSYIEKTRPISHKSEFDFGAPVALEKPWEKPYKSNLDFTSVEKPYGHEMQPYNPWKKIIKFLTALIPIGLLISALTPTVITVTPMNGTNGEAEERFRSSKLINQNAKKLLSSLGCEDRILCELILSAGSSSNGEEHVQNLLDTFTKNGKAVEKADEMRRIFEAVQNKDCTPIICDKIHKTK